MAGTKKTPEQNREAYRELQRSKLGRKARLRGEVVETISPTQTDLEDFTKSPLSFPLWNGSMSLRIFRVFLPA